MKKIGFLVVVLSILSVDNCQSQVVLGSNITSVSSGALLDLKNKADGTSDKGLLLPRIFLDGSKLDIAQSMGVLSGSYDPNSHAGLVVYNTNKCTLYGAGVYIWDGTSWDKIGKKRTVGISLNKEYFDIPSGKDARPLVKQILEVDWNSYSPLSFTVNNNLNGGVVFSGANILPAGSLANNSTSISLIPDVMTLDLVSPWQSKETKLLLNFDECNIYKEVTLNQTYYALKVNGQFSNSQIVYNTAGVSGGFDVLGNATWKTDVTGILSETTSISPEAGGETKKDGNYSSSSVQYTLPSGNRYDFTDITFVDSEAPKRFNDVVVSVINCNTAGNDPTMEQWAIRAGFNSAEISAVVDAQFGSSVVKSNGVQLHKDQSGNLFLSGDFGKAGRWMVNNLSARSFATTGRTGEDDPEVLQSLYDISPAVVDNKNPRWIYPAISGNGTSATIYNNNPRLGLLYNWAAATNSKGGVVDGLLLVDDGENSSATPLKRQGICPNGWHLPSDAEWTELELEFDKHASQYSGISDVNGNILFGQEGYRGVAHSHAMKDVCPAPGRSIATSGKANLISSTLPVGFNIMLTGLYSTFMANYGSETYFWTASGYNTNTNALYRGVSALPVMRRDDTTRNLYFSVRCKKD